MELVHHILMIAILLQDIQNIRLMDALQQAEHMHLQIMDMYLIIADSLQRTRLPMIHTEWLVHGEKMIQQHLLIVILEEQLLIQDMVI